MPPLQPLTGTSIRSTPDETDLFPDGSRRGRSPLARTASQDAREPAKICHANSDFATRLSTK